jgi:hypothetical protein
MEAAATRGLAGPLHADYAVGNRKKASERHSAAQFSPTAIAAEEFHPPGIEDASHIAPHIVAVQGAAKGIVVQGRKNALG